VWFVLLNLGGFMLSLVKIHEYCDEKHFASMNENKSAKKSTPTTGATNGAGTAHLSGAPEFTHGFSWGSCYAIFSYMCMFCR
jgi:hypothetical protein